MPTYVGLEPAPLKASGRLYDRFAKRAFDIFCCIAAAPLILPLVGLLALMARLDGGPAFFTQDRVGRGGKSFRCYKLRTMVVDAEERLQEYLAANPAAKAEWDEKQKLIKDPRVNAFGRFIRKTSLDELPQLWNILRGDMSLVGPRPMMVDQKDLYTGEAYYMMRPGLTGYWQIGDRNGGSFIRRVSHDERYYEDMSLMTDVNVLVRTVGVIVRGTGC
jgi:lipopolysaccharide/colanic/teichoic acid biosynthesis glycosyltransferase